jgi:predicted metal-dependent HD superfamily phosphohydrolase
MWNEPHRVYHNQEHLDEIISLIEHWKITHPTLTETEFELYILTAIFHDAIYDPRSIVPGENELKSAELFLKMCPNASKSELNREGNPYKSVSDFVYGMILDTKDHTQKPTSYYSEQFLAFDLHGMAFGSLSRMISDEKKIMREFGFVDYETYHNTRGTKFLEKFAPHIKKAINPNSRVDEYLDWYKTTTPKIAVS